MRFIVIKKSFLCWALLCIIIISSILVVCFTVSPSSMPKPEFNIVIDAGHGGRDGGTSGTITGITESELNLKYANTLKNLCEDFGIGVIMTRTDMNGLYDESASNKKKSEMEKRKNIINSSGADLMISIHMNSFPLSSCNGAQIFYGKGDEQGFNLAKCIQTSVCEVFDNARDYVTVGDYFVLNYSSIPATLIECGFLSNPEEEKKLQDDDYCNLFCYSILVGILKYFKM